MKTDKITDRIKKRNFFNSDFTPEEKSGVYRAIYERRDIRSYLPDAVPDEIILKALDAAHHAPSVGFMQPWNFILIKNKDLRLKLYEHFCAVNEKASLNFADDRNLKYRSLKLQGILDAPLNILVTCNTNRAGEHVLGRATIRETDIYSTCLAVQNFWLSARAEGLGVGWMSLYEPETVTDIFSLPEGVLPVAYLTVGYPVEFPEDPMLESVGWRQRMELKDIIYHDFWGNSDPLTSDAAANPNSNEKIRSIDDVRGGKDGLFEKKLEIEQDLNNSSVSPSSSSSSSSSDRLDNLIKPAGSLGMLEDYIIRLGEIQNTSVPVLNKKSLVLFAGDHGVTDEGVSAYQKEITARMVYQFLSGGGAVNSIARQNGIDLFIADMGVDHDFADASGLIHSKISCGTKNFIHEKAMTESETFLAIDAGRNIIKNLERPDIICLGEMGIGNTTSAAAIASAVLNKNPSEIAGRGTGIGDKTFQKKLEVIKRGLEIHSDSLSDPVKLLSALGGFEIAGMVGAILACHEFNIPVLLDGFITGSAALIACKMRPEAVTVLFAGHRSKEKGHRLMLDFLNLKPVLKLDMRLGEGSGAALAVNILESAVRIMREMRTFEEVGIENPRIKEALD